MSRAKKNEVHYTSPCKPLELLPFGDGKQMKVIRLDIPIDNNFLEVLTELCKVKQWDLTRYIRQALYDAVDLDLTSSTEIGLDVCKSLKEIIHPEGGT
jgi:hypothetical protein